MRRILTLGFLIVSLVLLSGCNPYASEFTCPRTDNGKCMSVADAYAESLRPVPLEPESKKKDDKKSADEQSWQGEMQKKISGLLKEPNTPLVVQPTVMRVLMLPYRGEQNELYMLRYVYMFVDEPRWVVGDYLTENQKMDGVQ